METLYPLTNDETLSLRYSHIPFCVVCSSNTRSNTNSFFPCGDCTNRLVGVGASHVLSRNRCGIRSYPGSFGFRGGRTRTAIGQVSSVQRRPQQVDQHTYRLSPLSWSPRRSTCSSLHPLSDSSSPLRDAWRQTSCSSVAGNCFARLVRLEVKSVPEEASPSLPHPPAWCLDPRWDRVARPPRLSGYPR